MRELKSYESWRLSGRQVIKGSKCVTKESGIAMFSEDQTQKIMPDLMHRPRFSSRAYSDPWEDCGFSGGYDP